MKKNASNVNTELLKILVCPLCKSELEYDEENQELLCHQSKLAYKIKNGIPIMLIDEAREMDSNMHHPCNSSDKQ